LSSTPGRATRAGAGARRLGRNVRACSNTIRSIRLSLSRRVVKFLAGVSLPARARLPCVAPTAVGGADLYVGAVRAMVVSIV
jgi:hypothetical protein